MKKDTTNDMTVGNPVSLIIKFMIPMCLGNLFQQFYNIADSIIAGKFIGVNALAAIGSTGSLMFFVTGWLNGLCSGFAIIIAQMFGAKKYDRMRHYVAMSVYLMAAFSITMTIGFSLANKPILHLMNSPEEVFNDVTAYMGIIYAGLIITGINLVGGIVMGMVYGGLSINDALSKYTILTIGDGLSSQIPSLLISLATGILVTKASSDGELGDEIVGQLFSMDRVLIMVGAALSVLGILTPLPWYIFVPLGAALIFYGRKLGTKAGEAKIEESAEQEENEAQEIRKPENVVSLLNVDPIELEFGYGIIPLADVNQGGDLLDRVVMIRRQIALELGAVVPIIRLRDNIQLNPNQYVIKIKGIQVSEGEILFDHYMAMNPGYVEEEITGIPTFEPSFHLPAIWITESQRERAESLGYTVVDPPSIIATHLTEVIRQHIAELLTRQDVQNLINNIKDNNSTLIDELVPKLMGIGEIQKVLQNLLEEGISIRDLVTILETLADHAAVTRDPDILTEYARQGLKRAISSKYFTVGEVTNVVTVDPAIEQEIMNSVKNTEQGSYLSLDPERSKKIVEALGNELKKLEDMGKNPIVITSPIVRMYFRNLAKDYYKDIIVISYNEVESNVELQSVGMVTA